MGCSAQEMHLRYWQVMYIERPIRQLKTRGEIKKGWVITRWGKTKQNLGATVHAHLYLYLYPRFPGG